MDNVSLKILEGVDVALRGVVFYAEQVMALERPDLKVRVVAGRRTPGEHEANRLSGVSRAQRSRHLDGMAVDVLIAGGKDDQDAEPYYFWGAALREASRKTTVPIRWGGSWIRLDRLAEVEPREVRAALRESVAEYVRRCRARQLEARKKGLSTKGLGPLLDFGHSEIPEGE
ncbi:MAG: hypothetical protein KIT41_14215 [Pyrinomonadaceae bacterium]|nr:hypothetical protein [Pyrinomonadaceae bacterium]